MSELPPGGDAIDLNRLRVGLDRAILQALDTDEFRQAIDTAVSQVGDDKFYAALERALDNDHFRQAIGGPVNQFLSDTCRHSREESVANDVELAVAWPVKRAVAEAMGIHGLAKYGTPKPLRTAEQKTRSIPTVIDAAVRDVVEQAFNRRAGESG